MYDAQKIRKQWEKRIRIIRLEDQKRTEMRKIKPVKGL